MDIEYTSMGGWIKELRYKNITIGTDQFGGMQGYINGGLPFINNGGKPLFLGLGDIQLDKEITLILQYDPYLEDLPEFNIDEHNFVSCDVEPVGEIAKVLPTDEVLLMYPNMDEFSYLGKEYYTDNNALFFEDQDVDLNAQSSTNSQWKESPPWVYSPLEVLKVYSEPSIIEELHKNFQQQYEDSNNYLEQTADSRNYTETTIATTDKYKHQEHLDNEGDTEGQLRVPIIFSDPYIVQLEQESLDDNEIYEEDFRSDISAGDDLGFSFQQDSDLTLRRNETYKDEPEDINTELGNYHFKHNYKPPVEINYRTSAGYIKHLQVREPLIRNNTPKKPAKNMRYPIRKSNPIRPVELLIWSSANLKLLTLRQIKLKYPLIAPTNKGMVNVIIDLSRAIRFNTEVLKKMSRKKAKTRQDKKITKIRKPSVVNTKKRLKNNSKTTLKKRSKIENLFRILLIFERKSSSRKGNPLLKKILTKLKKILSFK